MRERGIPEDLSTGKAAKIGNQIPNFLPTPSSASPDNNSVFRQMPNKIKQNAPLAAELNSPQPPRSSPPAQGRFSKTEAPPMPVTTNSPQLPQPKWQKWLRSWVLWVALASLISGGAGFVAVAMLLKLPSAPNCPAIFWPLASASIRLHCAQVAANKQTVNDLLEAIALVKALQQNHPLRVEINRFLEQWSGDILELGEAAFQAGDLPKAIAIARRIPPDVGTNALVEKRISSWQSIWSEAETIYQKAEDELRLQHWHEAFRAAVLLLNLNNNYWETTKYDELKRLIEITREDATKLAKAQSLAARGTLTNLLAALKLVESINASSYIYQDAQDAIPDFGQKMLDLAQAALDRRDAETAIDIANQIPASTNLQSESQDFINLALAWQSAWLGKISSLEAAIAIAQKISAERPRYTEAQELIARWQLEIEDVGHLERARSLAQQGTIGDLTGAISEAQLIAATNPRAEEAQKNIDRWRRQVETIEDQPYLSRAEALAVLGDVNSLQAAINEASQISRGRALYDEAAQKISTWTQKIQRIEDQPYLDQARLLADSGNLLGAIAAAGQIQSGRALSSEAQAAIADWRGQIQARLDWQQARQSALAGTPDALVEAIRLASRVPRTSPLRVDVNAAIAQWSQQIFSIALSQGESDISGGIAIAKKIPPGSDAYKAAQEQIATWENFLNPPEQPSITPE